MRGTVENDKALKKFYDKDLKEVVETPFHNQYQYEESKDAANKVKELLLKQEIKMKDFDHDAHIIALHIFYFMG